MIIKKCRTCGVTSNAHELEDECVDCGGGSYGLFCLASNSWVSAELLEIKNRIDHAIQWIKQRRTPATCLILISVVSGLFVGRIMAYLCPLPLMILYYLWGPDLHPSMVAKISKISHGAKLSGDQFSGLMDKLGKFFERYHVKAVILGPLAGPLYATQGKAMTGLTIFATLLLIDNPYFVLGGWIIIPLFLAGYLKIPEKFLAFVGSVGK